MNEQPIHPTDTPAPDTVSHLVLAEALVKLLTTELEDVAELHDANLTTWQLGSYRAPLHAEVFSRIDQPFELLRACAEKLGGSIAPESAFSNGGTRFHPHVLTTEWLGYPLKINVTIRTETVEEELRRRIAELEAQQGGEPRG
jgi:hypothetical protein